MQLLHLCAWLLTTAHKSGALKGRSRRSSERAASILNETNFMLFAQWPPFSIIHGAIVYNCVKEWLCSIPAVIAKWLSAS